MKLEVEVIEQGKAVKKAVSIPESWNDVRPDLFPHLASLFLKDEREMSEYDKQVRTFALLTEKAWPAIELLEPDELYDLLKLVDWVFDNLDLVRNLIPKIEIDGQVFLGPADELANLRWAEWIYADTSFVQYCKTKDVCYLDKLIGAIYRPAGTGPDFDRRSTTYRGDNRERFNGNNLEFRVKTVSKLPLLQKQAIYLFFLSCRWQMILAHPNVFPQPKPGDKPKLSKSHGPDFGWIGVHDDLCGEKGRTPEQLEDEFLSTVLLSLERTQIKWQKYQDEK